MSEARNNHPKLGNTDREKYSIFSLICGYSSDFQDKHVVFRIPTDEISRGPWEDFKRRGDKT